LGDSTTAPREVDGGDVLTADVADGRVVALLPTDDAKELSAEGLSSRGAIKIQRRRADGAVVETVAVSPEPREAAEVPSGDH
jgi:hypothetical protein